MNKAVVVNVFSFVGFSLANFLLNKGINVIGIVLKGEQKEHEIEQKLLHIGRNANLTYYNHDDEKIQDRLLDIDVIYFDLKKEHPILKEVIGKCKKGILISSLDVFEISDGKIDESSLPSHNDFFKLEKTFMNQARKQQIRYTIVRLPTVYGPWQEETGVYQQCMMNQLNETPKEIVIRENIHDILYIDDVIDALYTLGMKNIDQEIIHFASGKKNQWLEGLKLLIGKNHELVLKRDVSTIFYSNEKAKKLLNFSPKTCLEEGIKTQRKYIQLLLRT